MNEDVNLQTLPDEQVALVVEVLRMLADGTRFKIMWALLAGPKSVNELVSEVGRPGPAVSQHLAKLRMARLVQVNRQGQQMIYELEDDHLRQMVLDAAHNAEHAMVNIPRHHRDQAVTELPQRHGARANRNSRS